MVNTIFILDQNKQTTKILAANKQSRNTFWDDLYVQELATGAETFEFSCYSDEKVVEGAFVIFYYDQQYKMFTIMELEETHREGQIIANCYCEIATMELINKHVRAFNGDMSCLEFFQYVLDDSGWNIGKYNESLRDKIATIDVSRAQSVWSLIEDYKDIYECEINIRVVYENGRVTRQFIDVYAEGELGTPTHKRFEYGRNVTGITKTKDLYDWATALIVDVEGVNEITFSVGNGDPFDKEVGDVILDPQNNMKYNGARGYIMGVYQGSEKEPRTACLDAWKELQKRAVPRFDYEVTTALTSKEYKEIHKGDTIYVVDHSYSPPLFLEARVGTLELSFTDKTRNKCILTNYKEIKSKLLGAEYIKLTGTISDVVSTFFPIGPDGIQDGAIVEGKIDTVYYQEITADIISAGIGVFEDLYSQELTVVNADIENLRATKADINVLNAATADIGILNAQVGNITTLLNGNLSSDNIQSLILTSDKVTVADAFIKDAMIDTVSADKINAGSINTNNVQIHSEDGGMTLSGSTQQFRDKNGKVRIQIGKDAQGNFTFALFDENGTGILIDQDGITEKAIADGLIVNDMVADDANISGSKLDINSLVAEINNGSSTIKGSKIYLDNEGQSLQVAFNTLTKKVDNMDVSSANLLRNSSFEYDFTGWTNPAPPYITILDDYGIDNGKVVRITAADHERYTYTYIYDVEGGQPYTFSFYAKTDGAVGSTGLFVTFYNGGSYISSIAVPSGYLQGYTDWTHYSRTFTPPSATTKFLVEIRAGAGTATLYMDRIMIQKGEEATAWQPSPYDNAEMLASALTQFEVQQGQIESLISETTIINEYGTVVSLKDDYNTTKSTVKGNTTKIGSMETTLNSVSSQQAAFTTDLNGFKSTVSSTYATKNQLTGEINTVTSRQSSFQTTLNNFSSSLSSIVDDMGDIEEKYSDFEQTLEEISSIVGDENNGFVTESELKQTKDDWTATFRRGYQEGIVNMNADGITVTQGNGKVILDEESLRFYDDENRPASRIEDGDFKVVNYNGLEVGMIGSTPHALDSSRWGLLLGCEYNCDVLLGYKTSSDSVGYGTPLVVTGKDYRSYEGSEIYYKGLNVTGPIVSKQMIFRPNIYTPIDVVQGQYETSYYGWGYIEGVGDKSPDEMELHVMGRDVLSLGTQSRHTSGAPYQEREMMRFLWNTHLNAYSMKANAPLDMNTWSIYRAYIHDSTLYSALSANSDYTNELIDRKVSEDEFGIYSNMSFDKGEIRWCWKYTEFTYPECDIDPETDEWVYSGRNICYIELPVFMAENIEPDYHINISKMSWGDYRILEKNQYYFIIESEREDFEFTFEVVAKLTNTDFSFPEDREYNLQEYINMGEE